ncbi:GGDEF domain-containing protein [Lacticaseibacillus hulanensis]|uniref:GGDEF domain-containing protein n=1 Tax=Lacticaseibacillus hulanensis TaxID=2493111 RepID=UPI000FDADB34|nr:GGDEF domain-containing protein [Lacticaseibacillus hulanensis]
MFDLRSWAVEVVIAIFFISGFVAFYNTLAAWLTHNVARYQRGPLYLRIGLNAFAFLLAGFCLLAENWNPTNSEAYMNWALYVLFVPVIDRDVTRTENLLRFFGIFVFWTLNNNLGSVIYWLSLIVLGAIMVVSIKWARLIERSRVLSVGLSMWMAIAFWVTQTQLMAINVVMGVVMFALMELFTVLYWSADRRSKRERAELVEQVNRDTLTQARSFFAFKDESMRLLPRARRRSEPLTLAMFDIDHFKLVNDEHGHAAGNYVLTEVTKIVTSYLQQRIGDTCALYRTGGEEFNIIFLDYTVKEVEPLGRELLKLVRDHDFSYEGHELHITLSMGITGLLPGDMSFEDVYERADAHLYTSKQEGRDRITAGE